MASPRRGLVALALLMLTANVSPTPAQTSGRTIRILILYSHERRAPGVIGFTRELNGVLRREWRGEVEVYDETMDVDRLGGQKNWPQFASYLDGKYGALHLDAIVAEGSVAVQFAAERLRPVFHGTPVVYGAAFEPVVDFAALPPNVTGRRIPLPYAETFALAHRLQPGAKRVVVVSGAAPLDSVQLARGLRDITPLLDGVQLEVLQNWSYQSLLRELRELPKETFVLLGSFRKDWYGQSFVTGDIIPSITRASSVPVYGVARNWVGDGIVGGQTMEFAAEGGRTGRLLLRVLNLPPGAPLPPREVAVNPTVVDWRQLQRWSLSEKRLPKGTEVLFRAPSPWQRHRTMLLVIVGITIAQSALIGLLLLERQRRIRAQRWVESQAAFEQMLAAVKVEVAGQALDEAPHALEHAIAHLGRYAGAASAELSIDAPMPERSSGIVRWTSQGAQPSLHDSDVGASASVALPLMSEGTLLGTMTLHGVPIDGSHAMTRERLQLAADVITEALARTQSSQALAEARGHVAYLGRMATMGQLSAVVSHELRQPLTAIRFNADAGSLLLRKEPIDLRELSLVLRDIGNDAVLASDLIDQVRTLFRKQRGARLPVSINNVCRHAMRLLQRVAEERGVRVEVELAEELPEVPGDAVQLQQVVLNLELNAIESAAASEHERRVLIRTTQRANAIRLEVGDSGSGLPPVVREHLFQSGFSTKTSGFGMGLVIVHQIVLAHNGQVSADNRPGGGALFRVTLPIDAMVGMPPVTERSEVRLAGSAVFGS